jgi:glycerol-3-phosphate cytidylyltransferase
MKKYDLGYTTGAFDLFHIGHLNALRAEKEMCNYLIVGVSTDEHVIEYKGKKSIIPFEERVAIVEAIKYVDMVIPQIDSNKMKVWEKYKFNVLFTGSDWKGTDLCNGYEKQFGAIGVDVIYIPYTRNTSSSLLTEVLKKINSIRD